MKRESKRRLSIGWPLITGAILIVILLALTIIVTGNRDSTNLENGLVQFIAFGFGTAIAIGIGYVSAKEQAREIVRPHGRKAVRRIVTLGSGIQAFRALIETEWQRMEHQAAESGQVEAFEVQKTFEVLSSQVAGQLRVVEDAIEDWRDVVPEEVAAIEGQGERSQQNGG